MGRRCQKFLQGRHNHCGTFVSPMYSVALSWDHLQRRLARLSLLEQREQPLIGRLRLEIVLTSDDGRCCRDLGHELISRSTEPGRVLVRKQARRHEGRLLHDSIDHLFEEPLTTVRYRAAIS